MSFHFLTTEILFRENLVWWKKINIILVYCVICQLNANSINKFRIFPLFYLIQNKIVTIRIRVIKSYYFATSYACYAAINPHSRFLSRQRTSLNCSPKNNRYALSMHDSYSTRVLTRARGLMFSGLIAM